MKTKTTVLAALAMLAPLILTTSATPSQAQAQYTGPGPQSVPATPQTTPTWPPPWRGMGQRQDGGGGYGPYAPGGPAPTNTYQPPRNYGVPELPSWVRQPTVGEVGNFLRACGFPNCPPR
jgi:hypothetical protein